MAWYHFILLLSCAVLSRGEYLLPGDVIPTFYDVDLLYDVDPSTNFSYFGRVDIKLNILKPTSKIVLHAQGFTIPEEEVTLTGPKEVTVDSVKLNDTFNLLTLTLNQKLAEGAEYQLRIPFYGNLKQELDGAYISKYVDQKTKKNEYLVTTQFEAISARKGFPCFDEPMYKAPFKISIGHHINYVAVSNMPIVSTDNYNVLEETWPWKTIGEKFNKAVYDFKWDHFNVSLPMSTYLVAYVVSKFVYEESPPELSNTKFRIWANKDSIDQAEYAKSIAPRVLTHFEKWFDVQYPLPKQDMIAIPDFAAGAMENWGLITYRETTLLYDKKHSSFLNKERVAEVIAHELAHQWFGNLVTMKWWSDLWLNEGFATYAASVGVAAVEPTWQADNNYAVDNLLSVFNLDALESSHPVSVPIDDPKRIFEIFDEISYKKGSTLIRMMVKFLGEDVFRKAIKNYLIKYSLSNAEQDDLWEELTEVSKSQGGIAQKVTIKEIMDTWTTQTGYPILTVTRDYIDKSVTVTQRRYLSLGARAATSTSWWVPLRVQTASDPPQADSSLQWLAANQGVSEPYRFPHDAEPTDWMIFNPDMIAPYRVNYDPRNWDLLSETLRSDRYDEIPVLGRVQLLADAFALAATNRLNYSTTLVLASYLQREKDYLPISTALRGLNKIENLLKRSGEYSAFQSYVRHLLQNAYKRAGGLYTKRIVDGENLNSVKLQVLTSGWACRVLIPGCEENAMDMFQEWMNTTNPDENNPIPLDLRRTVWCVGAARGGEREWRFLMLRVQNARVAAARDNLLAAMACTRQVWLLNQFLEWAVTENSPVRKQDSAAVIGNVARTPVGYYVAREFFYNRLEDIFKAFNGQSRRFGYIIKTLLDQFTSQRELDEFIAFHDKNIKFFEETKLAVVQAIEKAKVNIDWIDQNKNLVIKEMRKAVIYMNNNTQ